MEDRVIRLPQIEDLNQVIDIENSCFPVPWSEEIFLRIVLCRGKYKADEDVFVHMKVMARQGVVIGYIIWEESFSDESGHILNLAVREGERGRGNGRLLLDHALKGMRKAGMKMCELEVRESNHNARDLYTKAGMMAVDRAERYYDDEDAIIYAIEF